MEEHSPEWHSPKEYSLYTPRRSTAEADPLSENQVHGPKNHPARVLLSSLWGTPSHNPSFAPRFTFYRDVHTPCGHATTYKGDAVGSVLFSQWERQGASVPLLCSSRNTGFVPQRKPGTTSAGRAATASTAVSPERGTVSCVECRCVRSAVRNVESCNTANPWCCRAMCV